MSVYEYSDDEIEVISVEDDDALNAPLATWQPAPIPDGDDAYRPSRSSRLVRSLGTGLLSRRSSLTTTRLTPGFCFLVV